MDAAVSQTDPMSHQHHFPDPERGGEFPQLFYLPVKYHIER